MPRANCAVGQVQVCRIDGLPQFLTDDDQCSGPDKEGNLDLIDRLEDVMLVVGSFFGVSQAGMRSTRRTAQVHRSRCVAVYVADRISGATQAEIGAAFGRDPTIIAMYCRAVGRAAYENAEVARLLRELEQTMERRWTLP